MGDRAYDLEAVVAAHRSACIGNRGWTRLSDMEYDAIAGTILRAAHIDEVREAADLLSGALEPGAIGRPVREFTRGEMADIEATLAILQRLEGQS